MSGVGVNNLSTIQNIGFTYVALLYSICALQMSAGGAKEVARSVSSPDYCPSSSGVERVEPHPRL